MDDEIKRYIAELEGKVRELEARWAAIPWRTLRHFLLLSASCKDTQRQVARMNGVQYDDVGYYDFKRREAFLLEFLAANAPKEAE